MILSILIPTLASRESLCERLVTSLFAQIPLSSAPEVEILYQRDNGEISIGVKRQEMLEKAQGEYVCFIDDDDRIDPGYIAKILGALERKPDCVCFKVLCEFQGGDKSAVISTKYTGWYDNVDGFDYVRCPNHLAVIKREHALKIGFNDMVRGEDADFSMRLRDAGLLKKEVFINEYLYIYVKRSKPC
jgi:glycosyltransferase involved in cell wall biosynthesis